MEKLYFECYSGISGDMVVASLLDLGADRQALEDVLSSLKVPGFRTEITRVKKSGIDACDFNVILDQDNHDHDMAYLFGHEHAYEEHGHDHGDHDHSHEDHDHGDHDRCPEEHDHSHDEHDHSHEEHDHCYEDHAHEHHHHHGHGDHDHVHPHEHRSMKEIREILDSAVMTDTARSIAGKIFEIIAQAEGQVHGVSAEEVHFHEVGAVDSIVDIVAAAVCLDNLGLKDIIIPVLYEGQGTIRCQHGIIPVPVPAVTAIAAKHQLALHMIHEEGEFVTPTGAAFAAAVRTEDTLPEVFTIRKIGLGAGKRAYRRAGVVRAMIIEA